MRSLIALVVVASLASTASAVITMEVVPVDNSAQLTGYVTQDLVITTDSDWLGAQLVVQPDATGLIYQDDMGNTNPQSPNPAFFSAFPTLEFDTYVTDGNLGQSVSTTGAVDLGGPASAIFDGDELSIAWYTDATDNIGTFVAARVTLADTAGGTWKFLATAFPAEGPRVELMDGTIVGGVMPEPATMGILALGGLIALKRRRR